MMQAIVDMLQILTLGAIAVLGVLLLVTVLRLKKMRKTRAELVVTIEEGNEL
ncbi:MAG: hypothetical protein ACW98U_11100 [Candidatus Thorarchaeota archaeon]|jgi:hypothetical protein